MEHLRAQLQLKANKQGKTGAIWWSKMMAAFGDADADSEALDLSNVQEDVEGLEAYANFAKILPPSYCREPLAQWARTTQACTRAECVIAAQALKRLNPQGSGDQYSTGMELMRMFSRLALATQHADVLQAVRCTMDKYLQQAHPWVGVKGGGVGNVDENFRMPLLGPAIPGTVRFAIHDSVPLSSAQLGHLPSERQLRLEAQALRQAQEQEQQAAQRTQEHELAIQELRRQAAEQPAIHKSLWRRELSQQSTYKAEIHDLYTEMLDMREKSEMQSHLAANMCKLEHSIPSRSVESEPENVLDARSPGRCS